MQSDDIHEYCDMVVKQARSVFKANPCKQTLANYYHVLYMSRLLKKCKKAVDDANFYFKFAHLYLPKEHYNNMMYAASVAKKLDEEKKGSDAK